MPQIVLMIPRRDDIAASALKSQITAAMQSTTARLDTLPFIAGECQLEGYRNMILVESVNWEADVEQERSAEGRRTVHTPKLGTVKIKRRVDLATNTLTRAALTARVSQLPWELYFLRTLGGSDGATDQQGVMQSQFMSLKLYFPLVTKYAFEVGEGEGQEDIEVSPTALEWIYQAADMDQRMLGARSVKFDVQAGGFV